MNLKIFMGRNIFSREKKNHYLLKVMICVSFNCNTRAIPQYLTHLFPVPVPLISIRTLPCTTFKKSYPYMLRTRHLISKLFCLGFRTRTPISKPARTLSVHYTHFWCVIGTKSGFRLRTSGYALSPIFYNFFLKTFERSFVIIIFWTISHSVTRPYHFNFEHKFLITFDQMLTGCRPI